MRNLDPRLYAFIYGAGSSLATFIVTFGTARLAGTALEPAFWISAVAAIAPYAIRQTEGIRDHNANKRADARAAEPSSPVSGQFFESEVGADIIFTEKPIRLERPTHPPLLPVDFDQPYHRSPAGIAHPGDHAEGCGWCAVEVR